jgi:hypothetical protein
MNEQQRAVVQQALEVLKRCQMNETYRNFEQESDTITALRQLLEQPVQEHDHALEQALTRLQKRYSELEAKVGAQPADWVGLTDEERRSLFNPSHDAPFEFARAIEAKLKEKNT